MEDYIELAEATAPAADDGKGGKPEEQYAAQLADLNKMLTDYQTKPTEEAAAHIDRQLTGLWRAHLDRKLVDMIHRAYGRPNIYATIRKDFIAKGVERPVSEKDAPLTDNILGTSISGRTTTVGQVKLELVPSPNKAVFDALLSATVASRTVGQNGPATIYANGTTLHRGSQTGQLRRSRNSHAAGHRRGHHPDPDYRRFGEWVGSRDCRATGGRATVASRASRRPACGSPAESPAG